MTTEYSMKLTLIRTIYMKLDCLFSCTFIFWYGILSYANMAFYLDVILNKNPQILSQNVHSWLSRFYDIWIYIIMWTWAKSWAQSFKLSSGDQESMLYINYNSGNLISLLTKNHTTWPQIFNFSILCYISSYKSGYNHVSKNQSRSH